ncbi:hypothetical protein SORBI_3001G251650 [Sorghum bicolor]|uniref:Uncharacterized protein n=1 Tax=Sorghum bicolor TaxID=4558 RepID=A0A1Z5S793_SORBI|nr:hypothetical protein SORBI_3001G251650 [Sorghum bicolor]
MDEKILGGELNRALNHSSSMDMATNEINVHTRVLIITTISSFFFLSKYFRANKKGSIVSGSLALFFCFFNEHRYILEKKVLTIQNDPQKFCSWLENTVAHSRPYLN